MFIEWKRLKIEIFAVYRTSAQNSLYRIKTSTHFSRYRESTFHIFFHRASSLLRYIQILITYFICLLFYPPNKIVWVDEEKWNWFLWRTNMISKSKKTCFLKENKNAFIYFYLFYSNEKNQKSIKLFYYQEKCKYFGIHIVSIKCKFEKCFENLLTFPRISAIQCFFLPSLYLIIVSR